LGNYYSSSGGLSSNLIASGTVLDVSQTVYVYATDPSGSCFGEISFDVVISSIDAVELLDVSVCDSYILPVLPAHHGYFTAPNGGGTSLSAGDLITSTQTIYVYAVSPDNSDCTDETSFEVAVGELTLSPISNIFECSPYVLPSLTQGNYYSAPGGLPGNILPVGTLISTTQTIYVYASVGVCTDEISFVVNINGVTAPVLESLTSCDVYILPVLAANSSYYTESGGNGTQLNAGSSITSTQTIYIYAVSPLDANCTDETSFVVTINQTPVLSSVSNILECGDFYTLPSLSVGGYFTAPNGGGSSLAVGSQISTTQTIYVYASNGSCSSQVSFTVTVPGLSVDGFDDVVICTSYILPSLSNGEFYTASGGSGLNLTPGSVLTSSQTVYVYESFDTCFAESSFEVTILACEIPRGISPNGDQFNQSLDLTNFDVAKLSIFNRYGKEVYSKMNYVDEWEGQTSGGSELPDGTYFYVVERRNGDKLTGWIYVNRER
jgi:gliding motility-associated-like protein